MYPAGGPWPRRLDILLAGQVAEREGDPGRSTCGRGGDSGHDELGADGEMDWMVSGGVFI